MTLAQTLSTYLTLNFLLVVGFCLLTLFSFFIRTFKIKISFSPWLRVHYAMIFFAFSLIALQPFLPAKKVFHPFAKVWAAESTKKFAAEYSQHLGGYLDLPSIHGAAFLIADKVTAMWILLGIILFLFAGARFAQDVFYLLKMRRGSYLLKRVGRVSLYANDQVHVPFSYWMPGQMNVVIPTQLLENRTYFRIAVAHEIQHHRNGDTKWVYLVWVMKLVCIVNPFVYFWSKEISEIQEFACDETLVGRKKVNSQAYARCLFEVAQSALQQKYVPVCATGLIFLVEGNIIKRRIENMFSTPNMKLGLRQRIVGVFCASLAVALMSAASYAAKDWVQDRRVTLAQANEMAAKVKSSDGFPIVVNDLVLKELNLFVGTPEGREFMRMSLQRAQNFHSLIQGKLEQYHLPSELLAVPMIESGYQNLTPTGNQFHGAGIWMFIKSTAKNYGLLVDDVKDDRLNVELETDAAMRLLSSDHLRFSDWQLALLSYNQGESTVQKAIEQTGGRDAWNIVRTQIKSEVDYLPKVIAAILISNNPESVQ